VYNPRIARIFGALATICALCAFVLIIAAMIYPVAGAYAKTNGFASESPTLDATGYIAGGSEYAAVQWVLQNTLPDALIIEGKGASYRANYNRISTMTGRPTLLGWDGHESQWRGRSYGQMAAGRPEALQSIYGSGSPEQLIQTLTQWDVDYVYVGPTEREQYGVTPRNELTLRSVMDLVFENGDVRIYRRRE